MKSTEEIIERLKDQRYVALTGDDGAQYLWRDECQVLERHVPRLMRLIETGRVNRTMTDAQIVELFIPSGLFAVVFRLVFMGLTREIAMWIVRKVREFIWEAEET